MQWSEEAEAAIKKVPFFVRKKVKKRVEKEAAEAGKNRVGIEEVNSTKNRFVKNMDSEIKGYQIDACFSSSGCKNSVIDSRNLIKRLEALFQNENILGFLREQVKGPLKFHHEFRVSVSDCPNGCSQPQIKDIGIMGAVFPGLSEKECTDCGSCVTACKENAVEIDGENMLPVIDLSSCLYCGHCIKACPEDVIIPHKTGFRVLLGGKLGRHPRLGVEMPGIKSEDEVIQIAEYCIRLYKTKSTKGKRFSAVLTDSDIRNISEKFKS